MFDVEKTKREIHKHKEINPVWWTKVSFEWDKGRSYLSVDMSDNFDSIETPAFMLAEGIGNMLAEIRKLMPQEEKEAYNEMVRELIQEIEKSLIHYSWDA